MPIKNINIVLNVFQKKFTRAIPSYLRAMDRRGTTAKPNITEAIGIDYAIFIRRAIRSVASTRAAINTVIRAFILFILLNTS